MSIQNPRQDRLVARYRAKRFIACKPRLLPLALASCFALTVPQVAHGQETISGPTGRTSNSNGLALEITHTGTITGDIKGLNNTITTTLVENRGLIQTSEHDPDSAALHNTGNIKRLHNTGTFHSFGHGVYNGEAGKLGSVINGGLMHGVERHGFFNTGSITSLQNAGTGKISSVNHNAFYNAGYIAKLMNSGIIEAGEGKHGLIVDRSGTIKVLENIGTIRGRGEGAGVFNNGTIGTIVNSGTIIGQYAIDNNVLGGALTIINSGTLVGEVRQLRSATLNIHGGTDNTFGTITGPGNNIGAITSAGNVNFTGGNLFLNANIIAPGQVVSNDGATLLINRPVIVHGHFMQNGGTLAFDMFTELSFELGHGRGRGYAYFIGAGDVTIARDTAIVLLAPPKKYGFAQGQRYVVILTAGKADFNEKELNYSAIGYDGVLSGAVVHDGVNSHLVVTLGPPRTEADESRPGGMRDGHDTSARRRPSAPVNRASTGNANSVLSGLFKYRGANTRLLDVHNAAAAAGSEHEANRLGAQLSPTAVTAGAAQASSAVSSAVHNIVSSRLATLRGEGGSSGVSSGESRQAPALWGQLFAGRADQAMRGNVSGYHANYKGMLIGGDVPTAQSWRSGALVSHARTSVGNEGNNSGSSASVESYGVTGYTSYSGQSGFVNLMAGMTRQRTNTTRVIDAGGLSDSAHGNFNGSTYTAALQGGRAIPFGVDSTLTPLAGLVYTRQRQNGYSETGAGGAALNVASTGSSSLKSDIGFKLARALATSYGTLTPAAQLRWRYEFRDSRLSTTSSFAADTSGATSFTTVGSAAPRNSGALVLSATLARKKNLTLSANYTLEAASGYKAQSGDVRVRWQY